MPPLEKIDPRILGLRIADSRRARGKTQEEVAGFLGCRRSTYIAIEMGDRLAKSDEIIKLAAYFGRKVHELVRPAEPIVDLQPHLRAVVEKMKGTDQQAPSHAIDELQRLAEDYRELERMMQESKGAPKQATETAGQRPRPNDDHWGRYACLAVSAYERGDIGDCDLAHYLRCDIVTAREIVSKTHSSREAIEGTGD